MGPLSRLAAVLRRAFRQADGASTPQPHPSFSLTLAAMESTGARMRPPFECPHPSFDVALRAAEANGRRLEAAGRDL